MKNPLIDAADKISAHLSTLQVGSAVTEEFIAEHQTLVENLQHLVETYLIESLHAAEGRKVLQNAYNELQKKLDDLQAKPRMP
jgi:hypothetical protein